MAKNYVAAGGRTDIEMILQKFKDLGSEDFLDFAKLWREMVVTDIFALRDDVDELRDLTEELIRITKEYWLYSDDPQINLAGFYLIYCFYMKQPIREEVKIRLCLEDFEMVSTFVSKLNIPANPGAVCLLNKLLDIDAFNFCAKACEYGPEEIFQRYIDGDPSLEEKKNSGSKDSCSVDKTSLTRLERLFKMYNEMKSSINPGPKCELNLATVESFKALQSKLKDTNDT